MASVRDEWVAASERFAEIRCVGNIPSHLFEEPPARLDVEAKPGVPLDLQAVLQEVERASAPHDATLVLCEARLRTRECPDLLGYSDRRARVVVLSTSALDCDGDPALLTARLGKVLAHEQGHLDGRTHCGTPGCVMRPVTAPAELDARSPVACARCRRSPLRRAASFSAAAAALVLAVMLIDAGTSWLVGPTFEMPFT